jgi:hypothetical protein
MRTARARGDDEHMSEFQQKASQHGDADILSSITDLVETERRLREQVAAGGPDADRARQQLAALEVRLDQCWDLLRQRRARSEFGENPDEAHVRPAAQVEGYQS